MSVRTSINFVGVVAGALFCSSLGLSACGSVDPGKNTGGAGGSSSGSPADGGEPPATGGTGEQAGAGNAAAGEGGGTPGPLEPLLPWAVGHSWTYRVTSAGVVSIKTTTIGEEELIGGSGPNADALAFHVTTVKGTDAKDHTESWQAPLADNPDRIVRYREQSFGAMTGKLQLEEHWDPEKLHIDGSAERTVTGASWRESYDETKLPVGLSPTTHPVREVWTVLDDDETVEVPAGTFEHVIHLVKAGGGSTKDYWYARGIGKLKEIGSQTEELTEYSLEAVP